MTSETRGAGGERFVLHHRGPCFLCKDAGATEFDFCRACGFTTIPFETARTDVETLELLVGISEDVSKAIQGIMDRHMKTPLEEAIIKAKEAKP